MLIWISRLFVRNLPYVCSDEDLQYLFKKYGEISDLQVIVSKKTGQCKGFAIVTYVFPESAVAAFSALDGAILKVNSATFFFLLNIAAVID